MSLTTYAQAANRLDTYRRHGRAAPALEPVVSLSPQADTWVHSAGTTYLVQAAKLCQAPVLRLAASYDGLARPAPQDLAAARLRSRAQRLQPRAAVEAVLACLHGTPVYPHGPHDAAAILEIIDFVAPGAEELPLRALAASCVRHLARAGCSLRPGYEALRPILSAPSSRADRCAAGPRRRP